MVASTMPKGLKVSIKFTPQAQDDFLHLSEDGVQSGGDTSTTDALLENDGGGAAAQLWGVFSQSETDVQNNIGTLVSNTEPNGNVSFIIGGVTVSYEALTGVITFEAPSGTFDSLAVGESVGVGTFTYVIRMSNGAFSTAVAHIVIDGDNDGPVISVVGTDSDVEGIFETNVPLTASGTLTVNDADTTDTVTVAVTGATVGGDYTNGLTGIDVLGFLSVTPGPLDADTGEENNATWNFDSDPQAFDFLQDGEELALTYTLQAEDHHVNPGDNLTDEHTVTITITGTDDAATFGGDNTGSVTEDDTFATGGTLTTADVDHDETGFQAVLAGALAGTYGDFTFDESTGDWTYVLRNGDDNVQALNDADQPTDTLTVQSLDGTEHDIVVTINGADDVVANQAPVAGADTWIIARDGNSPAATVDVSWLTWNDSDPDANPIFVTSLTKADGSAMGGLWDVVTDGAGHITGIKLGASNIGNLKYTLSDGTSTTTGTVTVINQSVTGAADPIDLSAQVYDHSYIDANNGNDSITGGSGQENIFYGGAGADQLVAGGVINTLIGGAGADILLGHAGADTFVFLNASDSPVSGQDTIGGAVADTRFEHGIDKIDVSAIDAGVLGFAANTATVSAHSVNWFESGSNTIVQADVNGIAGADFQVVLAGTGLGLAATDFIL